MKKVILVAILGVSFFALLIIPQPVWAETLQGNVLNGSNRGIPGLTVFLVHPVLGRSSPSFTDVSGHYFFSNVPLRPEPYYLEIYWGQRLLYRNTLQIRGNIAARPIVLR